ncbi:hypothetical protein AWB70_04222 [Caballeronia cordobensis]|uniref:Uncharacterized protein n=1 Tax=Caballeronia cordobensis TaxID=1353886 RepID=A0A158I4T4_CABCO|nr:hypothetical protein AWB70_04222 [Caballeronia cordobensis]
MRSTIRLFAFAPQNDRRRIRITLLSILAISAWCALAWLWLWPQLEGHYVADHGKITVDVTRHRGETQVSLSRERGDGDFKITHFHSNAEFSKVQFGDGLETQDLVFRPLETSHYTLTSGCGSIPLDKQTTISALVRAHPYTAVVFAALCMIAFMLHVVNEKAKAEPEVIYPMWAAYFGALFGSSFVLFAAGESGIFGFDGEPRNALARGILAAIEYSLDLQQEVFLLLGLLAFVSLTQWCAYLMAGLSGAARRPHFIWTTWKWVALLTAKALISASAVALSVVLVGGHFGWLSAEPLSIVGNALTSLLLLIPGLVVFCMVPLNRKKGRPVPKGTRSVHRWMIRRMRKQPGELAPKPE